MFITYFNWSAKVLKKTILKTLPKKNFLPFFYQYN